MIRVDDLDSRLGELLVAGFVTSVGDDTSGPVELTSAGEDAYTRLFTAREARIARELDGWHPELHASLLELLREITHELAASSERPGRDLDPA
jgi:hypothetical protein